MIPHFSSVQTIPRRWRKYRFLSRYPLRLSFRKSLRLLVQFFSDAPFTYTNNFWKSLYQKYLMTFSCRIYWNKAPLCFLSGTVGQHFHERKWLHQFFVGTVIISQKRASQRTNLLRPVGGGNLDRSWLAVFCFPSYLKIQTVYRLFLSFAYSKLLSLVTSRLLSSSSLLASVCSPSMTFPTSGF